MNTTNITVATVQHSGNESHDICLEKTISGIKKAKANGAQLVLLQELHASLYFCQTANVDNFKLAESIPGPTTEALCEVAKQENMVIVSSIFEQRAKGLYHNTAVVIEKDGSIVGIYRKMHIPDDPGFYEKFYFTPGDLGFNPIETSLGKLGVLICWDQWYPEAARLMTLSGCDLLLYPTAIGFDPRDDEQEKVRQLDAWLTIQRSHAIANGIPVISCNRVGFEADPSGQTAGIEFWGSSFICGPQGEYLSKSSIDQEEVLVANLDLNKTSDVRNIWPFLRDRRIDEFQDLTKRFCK